jgi:hypothetical protein
MNNFHKFKEALSEWAIKEYGHLGKLIEQGTGYVPAYSSVDRTTLPSSITQAQIVILETENLKKYLKHMNKVMHDGPKFYWIIMEHISGESKDAIKTEQITQYVTLIRDLKNCGRHWRKHTR